MTPDAFICILLMVIAVAAGAWAFWLDAVFGNPWKRCSNCNGTTQIKSGFLSNTFAQCSVCVGTGKHKRWFRKRYERKYPSKALIWGKKQ